MIQLDTFQEVMTNNSYIKDIINRLLSNLTVGFADNELAYLGLQSKYEGQIRDKFAWRLQCELDNTYGFGQYMVRREWPSLHDTKRIDYSGSDLKGRNKVDLAILKLKDDGEIDQVLALMEFKAHMFLNGEQWPYEEFYKDVMKMKELAGLVNAPFNNSNPDLYFVFLHGSPDRYCVAPPVPFTSAVQYSDILNGKTRNKQHHCTLCNGTNDQNFINEMKRYWAPFFQTQFDTCVNKFIQPEQSVPTPQPQLLGESFGYKLYCAPMLWGPLKSDDIMPKPSGVLGLSIKSNRLFIS